MPDTETNENLHDVLVAQLRLDPTGSYLIRLSQGDSLTTGRLLLQKLVNESKQTGIYLTCNANSPFVFLDNYFTAHEIDTSRVVFVDTVTRTFLGRPAQNTENAIFTEGQMTSAFMAALQELIRRKKDVTFLYLDSLTELMKYHDEREVTDFLINLIRITKEQKMAGLILSFYGEREAAIAETVMQYCDYYIDL